MSVSVTYASTCTVVETLAQNTDSAPASTRKITHSEFDSTATLNADSTPPATTVAAFVQALTTGAATIDLTALTGTNGGTINGTGLKVQVLKVKNLGANALTITPGASNGYDILGASSSVTLASGQEIMLFGNDAVEDVASGAKTIDLSGTGSQTSEWMIVLG